MDAFSYLSVMISLILGLAITQVLGGYRSLMQSRTRVTPYAPALTWSVLVIVMAVQSWWAMFGLRERVDWTFVQFAAVLLQTIVTYLLAALVLPDVSIEAHVDLREHYFDHRRWFFAMLIAVLVSSLVKSIAIDGRLPNDVDLAFHGVFTLFGVVGIASASPRIHATIAAAGALLLGAYIAILFGHLH
jgi:hypothetical protein